MRSTNENAEKCAVMQAGVAPARSGRGCASRCACTTSLQNVSGVNRRGMSATFIGVLKRSAGISDRYDRSCAIPFSVTTPFCSNSASGKSPRAFSTILPRGILILNARSSRKHHVQKVDRFRVQAFDQRHVDLDIFDVAAERVGHRLGDLGIDRHDFFLGDFRLRHAVRSTRYSTHYSILKPPSTPMT